MVAAVVDGLVGFGRLPDGVAQDLGYAFGGFVFPGREVAEAGAAAVDAEGESEGREHGKEAGELEGGEHSDGVVGLVGVEWMLWSVVKIVCV